MNEYLAESALAIAREAEPSVEWSGDEDSAEALLGSEDDDPVISLVLFRDEQRPQPLWTSFVRLVNEYSADGVEVAKISSLSPRTALALTLEGYMKWRRTLGKVDETPPPPESIVQIVEEVAPALDWTGSESSVFTDIEDCQLDLEWEYWHKPEGLWTAHFRTGRDAEEGMATFMETGPDARAVLRSVMKSTEAWAKKIAKATKIK